MSRNNTQKKSNWGGKRKGAGRKITGISTVVRRVPKDLPSNSDLIELITVLRQYKHESDLAGDTSSNPRWDMLRKFLSEVPENLLNN